MEPKVKEVLDWMTGASGITWGLHRQPTERVVRVHLNNYDLLEKHPQCKVIIDEAMVQFGRDNAFDCPTLLNSLLHRCDTLNDIVYMFKWLLAWMLRKKNKNPFSDKELTDKHGVIAEVQWSRRYKLHLLKEYAVVFSKPVVPAAVAADGAPAEGAAPTTPTGSAAPANPTTASKVNVRALAKACVLDPLLLYRILEGPDRKATLLSSMPTKAMELFMVHMQELDNRVYLPEVKGFLSACQEQKYSPAKFMQHDRPKHRFFNEFLVQYQALVPAAAIQSADPMEEPLPADLSQATLVADGSAAPANPTPANNEAELKRDVEAHITGVLDARIVCLTKDGRHAELAKSVASTELYQNLSEEQARFIGIYDVKNAKLAEVYEGQSLFQREPHLDETDFTNFLAAWSQLAKANVDLLWVLCGRHQTSLDAVRKHLKEKGMDCKMFHFIYNFKQMQAVYWKKQRGIANSRSLEPVLVCWKGKMPTGMAKERYYIDQGSSMFCAVVNRVPICKPEQLAWVDRSVREASLKTLAAPPPPPSADDGADDAQADGEAQQDQKDAGMDPGELRANVKRRKLYRQATDTTAIWFPFEMAVEVSQELVHESGGNEVRWVLHGSPGAGNVVLGSAQSTCSEKD